MTTINPKFYCQSEIEGHKKCKKQCTHCNEYYKPLENKNMNLKLGQLVYHKDIYSGKEQMKVVGIRETEVELEGDYSGGTHNVCQKEWLPIDGVLLEKSI